MFKRFLILILICLPIYVYANHQVPASVQVCLDLETLAVERYHLKNEGIIKAIFLDEKKVEQHGFYVSLEGMQEEHYRYGLVVDAYHCWKELYGQKYVKSLEEKGK